MDLGRRDLLTMGGLALAGAAVAPAVSRAQTPKRGGTLTLRLPSAILVSVWDGALKNYGPNIGYDMGGRLVGAWLDR